MKQYITSHGYYHIQLQPPPGVALFASNGERAYVIALLQDLLSPRFMLQQTPPSKQLSSCIDLLAFSLTKNEIHLLVFSIDASVSRYLASFLMRQLDTYTSEFRPKQKPSKTPAMFMSIKKLRGSHHALQQSLELHLLHTDWEYDRYSSIGFYLHDRRGDWMRIWRLTNLYENKATHYRTLIQHRALALPHG